MRGPTSISLPALLLAAGTTLVACSPTSIGEPRSPKALSVQSGAIAASAKASLAVYAANGDVIHKKSVGAMDVDELAARQLARDVRSARALLAAMPTHSDDVSHLTREKPEAVMSRLASRLSVAATDKRQLMDPTGHAKFRIKSQDGHIIELERSGQPGAPDTLATLRQDGVTIGSSATSWIKVADGWVAKQVRNRLPMVGGGAIEATLDLSDWRVSANSADVAPDGVTRVQSAATFCTAEDIEEGHCYWDWEESGYISQAEFDAKCSVLLFAATSARNLANIAIDAKLAFHYDAHLPACDETNPLFILGQCNTAYSWCMGLTSTMNAAVAAEASAWQAYYYFGCGAL